jgi:diguanylate cyclase (GGDEF)-like protein
MSARARLSEPTLVVRFALVSFLVFLILGVALAVVLGNAVQNQALSAARQTAYDDLHARLLRHISPHDLATGSMTGARYQQFDAFVRTSVVSDRTIRVKVWSPRGRVVYSDDRRIVGKTFPLEGDLSEALHGELTSDISNLSKSENRDDRRFGTLLEVYIPIQFHRGGPIDGVFEVYQLYSPVAAQVMSLQRTTYLTLAGSLVVLYLLLFSLVRSSSNTIVEQQRRLLQQAFHDDLTGLANRALLHDRVQQAIVVANRQKTRAALLLMDLDRFKEINDTFGHHYGDLLLQRFSERLLGVLRASDTLARLGGDEFAVLLPDTDDQGAVFTAEKLLDGLDEAFDVQEQRLMMGASIGIAVYPAHGQETNTLLQRADVAMYHAKRSESGYAVYASAFDEYSPDRLALINELRGAIDRDELVLFYQPKVNPGSAVVDSVEALVRWQHPERGLIPPVEFIPLAEHTGLIRPLTTWVLARALRQIDEWRSNGITLNVAVNLSARSLQDPQLLPTVAALLVASNVPAAALEIELTESALMVDPERGAQILADLHGMGLKISVDDFGTGYSSLAHLRHLPVDQIKIDKSFVQEMADNAEDVHIVRSVVDLGHSLGMHVVAEGVENKLALQMLARMGCDLVQGYHVSRPLPPDDFIRWFQAASEATSESPGSQL